MAILSIVQFLLTQEDVMNQIMPFAVDMPQARSAPMTQSALIPLLIRSCSILNGLSALTLS